MSESEKKIKEIVDAAGIMAETIFIFHKSFLDAGFNEKQAMYLCGQIISSMIEQSGQKDDE